MSEQKRYIIVAGINGAGKSTLYRTRPNLFVHSKRLNADEILQKMGGDWRKNRDNFKAMREEIKQLHAALDHGQSIHVETTLAGQGKAQLNLIDRAHKNGFEVTLLYVALKSEKIAINRVHERVKKGGHGVPDEVVKKRYSQSNHNLPAVAFKSDNVVIYDNSQKFVSVYRREHNQVIKNKLSEYPWINPKITFEAAIQNQLNDFVKDNPDLKIEKPMNDAENKNDRPNY
ncbi:AAA family ATPase [Lactobacillus plantarum]|nr:AAA family ATPase [Lactiplantibacillus plantarum]